VRIAVQHDCSAGRSVPVHVPTFVRVRAAGTAITVSSDRCDQPLAGAGLVGNPGGVVPVQAETAPAPDGTWSVQLVLPQGIDPDLDYVVVANCGNPDAGGFFYSPDLPFDVLPAAGRPVSGRRPLTG
jgi:hypothetical protein